MRGSQRQLREALPFPFTFRDPSLQEKYRVGLNRIAAKEVPIEIRPVKPPALNQLQSLEPKQMFWVRARGHIGKRTRRTEARRALCGTGRAWLSTLPLRVLLYLKIWNGHICPATSQLHPKESSPGSCRLLGRQQSTDGIEWV